MMACVVVYIVFIMRLCICVVSVLHTWFPTVCMCYVTYGIGYGVCYTMTNIMLVHVVVYGIEYDGGDGVEYVFGFTSCRRI